MDLNFIKRINLQKDKKISLNLIVSNDYFLRLSGHLNNVHIFSENNINYDTKIIKKGRNQNTKYLLLPRKLVKDIKNYKNVKCKRIDTEKNYIFIFLLDKINEKNKK